MRKHWIFLSCFALENYAKTSLFLIKRSIFLDCFSDSGFATFLLNTGCRYRYVCFLGILLAKSHDIKLKHFHSDSIALVHSLCFIHFLLFRPLVNARVLRSRASGVLLLADECNLKHDSCRRKGLAFPLPQG